MSRERLSVGEVRDFCHHFKVLDIIVGHFEVHVFHSLENISQSKCQVVEHQLPVVFDFLRREGDLVDKPHLLNEAGQFDDGAETPMEQGPRTLRIVDFPESPDPRSNTY